MKFYLLPILMTPLLANSQNIVTSKSDSVLNQIPYNSNVIIYEKIYYLDSLNKKEKIFNAVKSALIHNTNYRYSKIDEDRTSGNITCEITFAFTAKPGIAKVTFTGKSNLSFDIKDNRYRVRLYNNSSSTTLLNQFFEFSMEQQYLNEKAESEKGKWKASKSTILNWHASLTLIVNGFGNLVKEGMNDDF